MSAHDPYYGWPVARGDHTSAPCRPAEEAKPATESVYERARKALEVSPPLVSSVADFGAVWLLTNRAHDALAAAIAAGEAAEDELEKYQLRLAGVLTVLEGAYRPRPEAKGLLEYIANCPTFRAAWRLRDEVDAAEKRAEEAEERARRSYQDRYDALNVKSRDGLLSSEWLLRTGIAERERDEAIKRAEEAEKERDDLKENLRIVCEAGRETTEDLSSALVRVESAERERDEARVQLSVADRWILQQARYLDQKNKWGTIYDFACRECVDAATATVADQGFHYDGSLVKQGFRCAVHAARSRAVPLDPPKEG
jgi:hypothetical protein